ncbi:MAG: hypothetical protein ACYDD1_09030 [Caulobacteraceae bacterium]
MTENEAIVALLPIELLIELDIWIESLPQPISRADAVRAFVTAGLNLVADATDPLAS